ncbi:MAG: dipeptidase [Chloroflexi bacterium]|nr:dipeptidase [Chloroflexota bacterium]
MHDNALIYAQQHKAQFLSELKEWLAVPSISTLPEHTPDMYKAAAWVARQMEGIGLENVALKPTGGHPIVYGDWLHALNAPTILIYGHYDVQPVDPLDEWQTPPFEPSERQGYLYGRGTSDDKGQIFIHLKAVESYLKTNGNLPVNVKFLIEGEEEIGSKHLADFIRQHKAMLRADIALVSDTHIQGPDQPSITYGLRGLAYLEVELTGPAHDLHSGSFGGAVANPLEVLCRMIASLKDNLGHITIPGFYGRVRTLSPQERAELARIPYGETELMQETGVPRPFGEAGFSINERIGARPTLEVHGIQGGFVGKGSKTVIPARASAKISMRLVPDQNFQDITRLFTQHIQLIAPDTVHVKVTDLTGGDGIVIDPHLPALQAAARAYEKAFGQSPIFTLTGGSIPVVADFKKLLSIDTVLMGFGLSDDNLHAPNERYLLQNFYRGIETSINYLVEVRGQ